jgi:hypothetical protein
VTSHRGSPDPEPAWRPFTSGSEFESSRYFDIEILMNEEELMDKLSRGDDEVIRDNLRAANSTHTRERTPPPPQACSAKLREKWAAAWLVLLDAGASLHDRGQFDQELMRDPRRHAAFLRLSVAWERSDALRKLRSLDGDIDADLLKRRRAIGFSSIAPNLLRNWLSGRRPR